MLFEDARQNDFQVICGRMKGMYDHSDLKYDFSDEAYANAREIFEILKPMTAVGYDKARLGSRNDGGYIFLDAWNEKGAKLAYSFGISYYDPFSLDMTARGYDVWQYDGTISIPPHVHPRIHFNRYNLSGDENPKPNERSLRQIIDENGHRDATDIILQCDIEDHEWFLFETASTENLMKFTQISVELHGVRPFGDKWRPRARVLKKLNETHQIIHVHANNFGSGTVLKNFRFLPTTFEVSYVRKNFCRFTECAEEFPTALDTPCNPNRPEIFIGNFNPAKKAAPDEDQRSDLLARTFPYTRDLCEYVITHELNKHKLPSKLRRWLKNIYKRFVPSIMKQFLNIHRRKYHEKARRACTLTFW